MVTDTFAYDSYGNITSRTGTTEAIFLYNGEYGVVTDSNGLLYMRARYYSPELRRFINADILMGDINNSSTLNRYAYANGNPISNIDPFGLAADEGRGGNSNLWNSLLNFGKDFVTMSGNILESVFVLTSGFEIQAGYGTGLRGSANVLGDTISMSAGGKVDLLTFKITYNEIDIGQEALLGTSFSLANIDWLSFDINEGYYESFIDGEITEYKHMKPEATIELAGIDIYLIIGVNASISYDYGSVWERLSNVWK